MSMNKAQQTAADISALLRARTPLLWVATKEESRVEKYLVEAAGQAGYKSAFWDCVIGGISADRATTGLPADLLTNDLNEALAGIAGLGSNGSRGRMCWIIRDVKEWLKPPIGLTTLRALRNLCRQIPKMKKDNAQAIILISASSEIPEDLQGHATLIEFPLPDRSEIGSILDAAIRTLPESVRSEAVPEGTRDACIDAAIGLAADEVLGCYAKSLVTARKIDPAQIAKEKKRVIAKEKVLEYYDPIAGGLDAVGGLDVLKGWLVQRKLAYSPKARAYGLPAPKGCLLVGVPGCGKSLTAKAIATAWGIPLLKVDLNGLKSKYVGESEGNLRKMLRVIEAIGRCVVWIDEIEKALAGALGPAGDGGVSADVLGTLLSWMQERQGDAFVIATANDVTVLPPELLRKGRWDEIFFVDLPDQNERCEILTASLRGYGRVLPPSDVAIIAEACENFTGSEIAAIIPEAMFAAFAERERELQASDLAEALRHVSPLAKTAAEKIKRLRSWADGRARRATSVPTVVTAQ